MFKSFYALEVRCLLTNFKHLTLCEAHVGLRMEGACNEETSDAVEMRLKYVEALNSNLCSNVIQYFLLQCLYMFI